jgi:hypothetical protein
MARLALHHVKELVVILRGFHLIENELHGFDFIHVIEEFAKNPNFL